MGAGSLTPKRRASRQEETSSPARSAESIADSGGRTPSRRAHASRWGSVWQQQSFQQCSAVPQPQGQASQGNRWAPAPWGTAGRHQAATVASGNGAPLTTTIV